MILGEYPKHDPFFKHGKNCARNHGSVSKARYKLCAQDIFFKHEKKLCAQPRDQIDVNYPIIYHTSVRTPHAKACLGKMNNQ